MATGLGLETLEHVFTNAGTLECSASFGDLVRERIINAPKHIDRPETKFRASKIGRPWIIQVLDQWFYGGVTARKSTVSQQLTMLNGSIIQEVAAVILDLCNYKYEAEVELRMFGITGHADLLVDLAGEVIVLECKSMASHLISSFANAPSDEYGYLSQLSFYAYCTRIEYAGKRVRQAFLLFDRSTSKFRIVEISPGMVDAKVKRMMEATKALEGIERYDFNALFERCLVPPPIGGEMPKSMRYSRWAKQLYHTDLDGTVRETTFDERVEAFSAMAIPSPQEEHTQLELDL